MEEGGSREGGRDGGDGVGDDGSGNGGMMMITSRASRMRTTWNDRINV